MRNKSKLMIVMCIMIAVMATGYAAFNTVLNITGTASISSEWKVVFSNIIQQSKTSGVTIKTQPQVSGTSATFDVGLTSPGDKIVYKITLANQGTLDAIITDIVATATDSSAIIFKVEGVSIGDTLTKKTSKDITVTIEYDPNTTTQPEKLSKTLTVNIVTEQKMNQSVTPGTPNVNQPMYLSSAILNDNVAYADNAASPYVTNTTGIDFSQGSSDTNGKGLYYTSVNTEDNKLTYYFRGNVENNYVNLPVQTGCEYNNQDVLYLAIHSMDLSDLEIEVDPTKNQCLSTNICDAGTFIKDNYGQDYRYVAGVDASTCSYFGGTPLDAKATYGTNTTDMIWRIVRINEDGSVRLVTQDIVDNGSFNIGSEITDTEYYDNAYVGYMYGVTEYSFCDSPYLGKILQTPGDVTCNGTIDDQDVIAIRTMINQGQITKSMELFLDVNFDGIFNEDDITIIGSGKYNINNYSSLERYNRTHTNAVDSTMKIYLDEWYENNLSNYTHLMSKNAGFCNDRSIAPSAGLWNTTDTALGYSNNNTYYGVYNRLYNLKQPQYGCPQENDLFTLNSSIEGNKKLTSPIGLLTGDEVVYAGASNAKTNENTYLRNNHLSEGNNRWFWTMSATRFDGMKVAWLVSGDGGYGWYLWQGGSNLNDFVASGGGIRPVINLKLNVEITGGNGTSTNPYVIKTN